MKRSDEFWINDRQYFTNRFNTEKAIDLENLIAPILGGGLGRIMGAFKGMDDLNGDALGQAVEGLFSQIVAAGGTALYKKILAETQVVIEPEDGQPEKVQCANLNVAFEGRLLDLKKVTIHVLKFNFQEYFTVASGPLKQTVLSALAQQGITLNRQGLRSTASSEGDATQAPTQ